MIPSQRSKGHGKIPVEVAFSTVFKNKRLQKLTPSEYGAFILLCQVALIDGIYPLPIIPAQLARLARAQPRWWLQIAPAVLPVVEELLPKLHERFALDLAFQRKRSENAKIRLAPWHAKLKAASREEVLRLCGKKTKHEAQNITLEVIKRELSDKSYAPTIIQPQKAKLFRPTKCDLVERKMSDKKLPTQTLHD